MQFASWLRHAARRLSAALATGSLLFAPALDAAATPESAAAASACPPAAPPLSAERVESGMKAARDHGFLWRISKDGRVSYLYGTIHVARFEWMFPGPQVQEALRESDVVALEIDLLDADVQRRFVKALGESRGEALPPALLRRLEQRRRAECVDAAFAGFPPEFQVASLATLAARRDGLDPSYAIDLVLAGTARNLGKDVVSLESPESQLAALQMGSRQESIEFVKSGLDELDSGHARPLMNRIAKAWVGSDYAELAAYEKWCDCLRTPLDQATMRRLLDERNPGLADGIDALHAGGKRVFAAVGSLHMVGAKGLPTLLRNRGYKVEQGEFER